MNGRAGGSRDAGERREQMLRAALEVIIERGYAETRIADVAERTGTSPALVGGVGCSASTFSHANILAHSAHRGR